MVRNDELRAEKLRQVGRRIKNGSSMVTPMAPVKRRSRQAPAPPSAAMT